MKRNLTTALAALALTGAATFAVWPGTTTPALADNHGDKAHADHEKLEELMETINSSYRQARRGARDASKNQETADHLATMIAASIEAKTALPGVVHGADDNAKDGLIKVYRKTMNDLIIVLAKAENAALEDRNDELEDLLKEANEVKGVGHELFIPEDEQ